MAEEEVKTMNDESQDLDAADRDETVEAPAPAEEPAVEAPAEPATEEEEEG